jgi:hypothetical protein
MAPYLARIDLYPIKSLDGLTVTAAPVLASGALQHDRAWALLDQSGRYVNGKRFANIHQVRSRFAEDCRQVSVWFKDPAQAVTFGLDDERIALEQWFSDYFEQPVTLQHNADLGFPDDTDSPGPTVISTATLQTVADWFGLSLTETRRRFRTNLEIDGVPPFWEDRLFSASGEPVPFQIGDVRFWGINPCQRCVVPTRDSQSGQVMRGFQQTFGQQRAASLPADVARSRFNHFYRLAINTRRAPDAQGSLLRVGDAVSRLE